MSYYEYHVARRYVQFEGALKEFGNYASLVGRKVLLLTACGPVREQVEERILQGLNLPAADCMNPALAAESPRYARYVSMTEQFDRVRAGMEFVFRDLGDPVVCEENVRDVAAYIRKEGFDTVAGIGGGKGQDFARALTHYLPLKVILVPTLAATNASVSTLSVLYTPDGRRIREYWRMDSAPDLVLADTELLVRNPPRLLSAGIGDIAATCYEALCNLRMSGKREPIPVFAEEGIALAVRIIRENAREALEAVKAQRPNRAFETVLSMILHNPGPLNMICLTGYAHVLDEIFLYFDRAHAVPHGLRVGWAVLAMLTAQRAEKDELLTYLRFCRDAGIPVSLAELGLDGISRDTWMRAFSLTAESSGSFRALPFPVTAESLIQSILDAEAFVSRYRRECDGYE